MYETEDIFIINAYANNTFSCASNAHYSYGKFFVRAKPHHKTSIISGGNMVRHVWMYLYRLFVHVCIHVCVRVYMLNMNAYTFPSMIVLSLQLAVFYKL